MITHNKHFRKIKRVTIAILACTCLLAANARTAFPSGFAVFDNGAGSLGRANAVIAEPEGPDSQYFNPAAMTKLKGTNIVNSVTAIVPSRTFESQKTAETTEFARKTHFPIALFISHQLNDWLWAGLGINNNFGLGNSYPRIWEGRYIVTNSEMTAFNINPNVAVKLLNDKLSFGGGVSLLYATAEQEKMLNLKSLGLPDGQQNFKGDGSGFGWNVGALYNLSNKLSVGAGYRSRMHMTLDGEAEHRIPQSANPVVNRLTAQLFPKTDGTAKFKLPDQAFAGIAYKPTDKLLIELAYRWEGWSVHEEIKYNFDKPINGNVTAVVPRNWHNTSAVSLGGRLHLTETLALYLGGIYEQNPIPDSTFEPSIPGSDKFTISTGIRKDIGCWSIALAYLHDFYQERTKENNIGTNLGGNANGKYKTDLNQIGLSIYYKFK